MTKGKKDIKFHIIFWVSTFLLLVLDQFSKYLAIIKLKNQSAIYLINNVFCLQYLENKGAAFGIMQGKKVFFVLMTLIFFALVTWIYYRLPLIKKNYPIFIILSLFLSGAAGNFIDRIMQNYVVDFFYFELINFPIFNVADIYVTCGTILFIICFLFIYKEKDFEELSTQIFPSKKGKS